jgi:hypothetical protein
VARGPPEWSQCGLLERVPRSGSTLFHQMLESPPVEFLQNIGTVVDAESFPGGSRKVIRIGELHVIQRTSKSYLLL